MSGLITFALLILLVVLFRVKKINDSWITHLIVNLIFYGFYAFLIYNMQYAPKTDHETDRGLGVALFIIVSWPFLIVYNISSIVYAYKQKQNANLIISIIGLIPVLILITYIGIL